MVESSWKGVDQVINAKGIIKILFMLSQKTLVDSLCLDCVDGQVFDYIKLDKQSIPRRDHERLNVIGRCWFNFWLSRISMSRAVSDFIDWASLLKRSKLCKLISLLRKREFRDNFRNSRCALSNKKTFWKKLNWF